MSHAAVTLSIRIENLILHPSYFILFFFVLAFFSPSSSRAQFFPVYDHQEELSREYYSESHTPYPFGFCEATTNTLTYGIRPFYSVIENPSTEDFMIDVLWPLYTYRNRPETVGGAKDYKSKYIFPVFFSRVEVRDGVELFSRMIVPIWFEGKTSTGGKYYILFPFIWYVDNTQPGLPLMPARKIKIGAFFPIAGQANGYFNRDHISFFLWPLFVYSSDGKKGTDDYNKAYSLVWPITGYFTGPKVKGFRLWPLFAWVEKEDEFTRSYFLWPLGLYKNGRISKSNEKTEKLFWLLPFYADWERENMKFNMVFPFYGHLTIGEREVKGYALGLYNVDYNYRKGVKEQRWIWFIGRKRSPIEGHELADDARLGGGVFPIYTNVYNKNRVRKSIAWPFYHERYDDYGKFKFYRTYFVPFYAHQARQFTGTDKIEENTFFFPFYRSLRGRDGIVYTNIPHLFPYIRAEAVDRNYAPLWSWWEKWEDLNTGAKRVRLFKNAWKFERSPEGATREQLNLLLFSRKSDVAVDGTRSGNFKVLGGLVGRYREPDGSGKFQLLWMKF